MRHHQKNHSGGNTITASGTIIRWNDERGFGFIREDESTAEIFAHIIVFAQCQPHPQNGERVTNPLYI